MQVPEGRTGNPIALSHLGESYQTMVKLELSSTVSAGMLLAELGSAVITTGFTVGFPHCLLLLWWGFAYLGACQVAGAMSQDRQCHAFLV